MSNASPRERATSGLAPLGILGVVLVPLVVAGLLVWALWNPGDRLSTVTAAIVNDDSPVEIDGRTFPLGRQLAAELVSGDVETNYTWTLTSEEDAAAGLDDGDYVAVVTIPSNFSSAATSFSGAPAEAERAVIDVATSDRSRLVDDAISQTITQTAATIMGRQLTQTYLDNVYLGFNTLGEQLGDAAGGATTLADGAASLADGASALSGGTTSLADGASALADGASGLSQGVGELADGAATAARGANDFATQLSAFTGGVQSVATSLADLKAQTSALPGTADALTGFTSAAAGDSASLAASIGASAQAIGALATEACTADATSTICAQLTEQAAALGDSATRAQSVATSAGTADAYAQGLSDPATGLPALAGGVAQLADGAAPLGANAPALAAGARGLADGVTQLSGGLTQLRGGATELSDGASDLAAGTSALAAGASGVADGTARLRDGSGELASGLGQAADRLPAYSEQDRDTLSQVVAEPVSTSEEGSGSSGPSFGFGDSSLPLYAVLALWIGAMAIFIVLGAFPRRMLESTRPSALLALRSFGIPAAVGALQGLVVALVLGIAQGLAPGEGFAFAGLAVLGGVAFAAVNQALVVWLGGAGRFLSMVVALVVLATGVVSTAPGVLDDVRSFLPVEPVIDGVQAVLAGASAATLFATAAALIGWTLLGLAATTLRVSRRRTIPRRTLLREAAVSAR